MIERFVTTLRTLAALPAAEQSGDGGRPVIADCADAVRLELDCPQQDFTRDQRATLRRLGELLEDAHASAADIRRAAAETCVAFGIVPTAAGERAT